MEEYYTIAMKVNAEMEETLKGIFANCDWDYDKLVTKIDVHTPVVGTLEDSEETDKVIIDEEGNNDGNGVQQGVNGYERCPHCFLSPWATQRTNSFLGNGQDACAENSGLRRHFYREYWKAINFLGGWKLSEYKRRKVEAGHGEWVLRHRREVMPYRALSHVRSLYPNPAGIPYMGHKWE